MLEHTCKDCTFSASLGWAEPETGLIFCIHPQMGHIGNWAQRVLKAKAKPVLAIRRKRSYQALSNTGENISLWNTVDLACVPLDCSSRTNLFFYLATLVSLPQHLSH